jgi:hypothetical protein
MNFHFENIMANLTGRVIEFDGVHPGRKELAVKAGEYVISNPGGKNIDLVLDATRMDLVDDSVDCFISEVMIEHILQPDKVLRSVIDISGGAGHWFWPRPGCIHIMLHLMIITDSTISAGKHAE